MKFAAKITILYFIKDKFQYFFVFTLYISHYWPQNLLLSDVTIRCAPTYLPDCDYPVFREATFPVAGRSLLHDMQTTTEQDADRQSLINVKNKC